MNIELVGGRNLEMWKKMKKRILEGKYGSILVVFE